MFKLEKEMTPIVTKWLSDKGFLVKTESGILHNCDVVGCRFDPKMVELRSELRQKTVISAIELSSIATQGKICKWLKLKPVNSEPYEWMPIYKSLIAIELKLSRIADVIDQAHTNAYSVTASYIAMPWGIAHRAIGKARIAKVGIVSVGDEGKGVNRLLSRCQILLEPTHEKCMNSHALAESFWRIRNKPIVIKEDKQ